MKGLNHIFNNGLPTWAHVSALIIVVGSFVFVNQANFNKVAAKNPMAIPAELPSPDCERLHLDDCYWKAWQSGNGKAVRVALIAGHNSTVAQVKLSEQTSVLGNGIDSYWRGEIDVSEPFREQDFKHFALHAGNTVLRAHINGGFHRAYFDQTEWELDEVSTLVYSNPEKGVWVNWVR